MDAVEEVVTAAADEVVSAEVVSPPISRSLQDAGPVSHPSNTTHIDARARQDCEGRRDEGDWITFLQPMSSRTGKPPPATLPAVPLDLPDATAE